MLAEPFRRITLDEIRAAIEKTGFKLKQSVTLNTSMKYGCPIGIICLASGTEAQFNVFAAEEIGLEEEYRVGFTSGFDGDPKFPKPSRMNAAGFADGMAARSLL